MREPTRTAAIRYLVIVLSVSGLCACEESLPPYVLPDAFFQAHVRASDLVVDPAEGVVPGGVEFAVDVTNILDSRNQFILNPPYDVEVTISVFIESDPNRKRTVETQEQIADSLEPGESVRLFLPFPMTDGEGYPWSWDGGGPFRRRYLILIGKVHIPQVGSDGIDIPTDRKKIRFYVPFS